MKSILVFCSLLFTCLAFAQNEGGVRGTILDYDLNNEPMLYATVQIKNTAYKTETNFHGNFEFNDMAPGDYTLVVTYLGYETLEMPLVVQKNSITEVFNGLETKKLSLGDVSLMEAEAEHRASNLSQALASGGSK